ncbi:MAG: OmpA family protein [Pseudomonadota bacterium]
MRRVPLLVLMLLPVLLVPAGVRAADAAATAPQYIALLPYFAETDNDRGANHGPGLRLAYGRQLSGHEHWYWETDVAGEVLETGINTQTDFYQTSLSTGLAWTLRERTRLTPYAIGSIGIAYNDVLPDSEDDISMVMSLGAGVVSGSVFDNGLKLRAEARWQHDWFADEYDDLHLMAGLEIPLGRTRIVEKIVIREVPVEKIVEVEKVVTVPVPVSEPPADTDEDGVPDIRDRCPNTLKGLKVDANGCVTGTQTLTLANINFESGSAVLTRNSLSALWALARALKDQPDLKVEIAGHTDSQGNDDFNLRLSQKRAEAVHEFLARQNIDPRRMRAAGYGESQPLAGNDTPAGRAMNRRVEFRTQEQ